MSQIYFLDFDEGDVSSALASALPEIRDLGWVMKLMDGNYLYGATFIQPFDPFPAIIDTWKESHSMGYITATLLEGWPGRANLWRVEGDLGWRKEGLHEFLALWAGHFWDFC